ISAGSSAASLRRMASTKPRAGGWSLARAMISAIGTAALAAAISSRLVASIFFRISVIGSSVGDRDQAIEAFMGAALVDRGGGLRNAFGKRRRTTRHDQRRTGVHQHRI